MSTTAKWLLAAAALVILGLVIFAAAMSANGWDFTKLGTQKYDTHTYQISESFTNLSIKTTTANVLFAPSEDDSCKVVCYEQKNVEHAVSVQDGMLTVTVEDNREWYEHIGIGFQISKITVYLPQREYEDLSVINNTGNVEIPKNFAFESITVSESTGKVTCYACASRGIKLKASTGNIQVKNTSAGSLDLSTTTGSVTVSGVDCAGDAKVKVSTGSVKLTDVTCESLTSKGSTGSITLTNVIASEAFSIKTDTGSVRFDSCDASEIYVQTDTGSVTGTLLSDKVFFAESDTGSISVPKTTYGGRCEVTTDTGDIKLKIQ